MVCRERSLAEAGWIFGGGGDTGGGGTLYAMTDNFGLPTRFVLLEDESAENYDGMLNALRAKWQPKTQTENDLVVEMANAQWRLYRVREGNPAVRSGHAFDSFYEGSLNQARKTLLKLRMARAA